MSKSDCYLMQHLYAHAACNLFSDLTAKYNLNNNASIGRFRFELWATFHADLVNLWLILFFFFFLYVLIVESYLPSRVK